VSSIRRSASAIRASLPTPKSDPNSATNLRSSPIGGDLDRLSFCQRAVMRFSSSFFWASSLALRTMLAMRPCAHTSGAALTLGSSTTWISSSARASSPSLR
jgi:hypothetical protein